MHTPCLWTVHHQKRAALFTKLTKELTAAAKAGGTDPASNLRLSYAIARAKHGLLPKDKMQAAIDRAEHTDVTDWEHVVYEGRGPGGTAVYVEALTDNRKRTAPELRHAFTKAGGELGVSGSVSYLFDRRGVLEFTPASAAAGGGEASEDGAAGGGSGGSSSADGGSGYDDVEAPSIVDVDTVMEIALESGALDVIEDAENGVIDVLCEPHDFAAVQAAFAAAELKPRRAELLMLPQSRVELSESQGESLGNLLEALEDLEDVHQVYHNAE